MSYMSEEDFKNLKPGDIVTIRDWDEMAEDFGINQFGSIDYPPHFTGTMRYMCGKEYVVPYLLPPSYSVLSLDGWNISRQMLKPKEDPITIDMSLFDKLMIGN